MDENTNGFARLAKPRSTKLKSRVDLTAMVSVSFLLIAFYMINVELSKPKIMDLGMPDDGGCGGWGGCGGSAPARTMTLLLDDNDKIISYLGILDAPEIAPRKFTYAANGIRRELIHKNEAIKKANFEHGRPDRGLIVLIKPSKQCNYGNLVDILDEISISGISTYAIVNDFTPEEANLLAAN